MRVLVTGGRDFTDRGFVFGQLDAFHAQGPAVTLLIHGACRGVDTLAKEWAEARRIPVLSFPADWDKYGPAAGPIRNKQMIDEGKPDMLIAFPGGKGTASMIRQANAARLLICYADHDG